MKTKCSFILKTSVALLLAILMVFGSVSTVIAAVVDVSTGDQSISTAAKKGLDIAGTAANADLAASGAVNWYDYGGNNHHYIYYDDSTANISAGGTKNVYAMMGYSGGSNVFKMTRVSTNALLYSLDYDNRWTGCAGFGVKGASSTPSGAVTTADRYTTTGNFNGNAVVFAYGSKTGTTLTATPWDGNGGDLKSNIKNNVTLSTKVANAGSSTYNVTTTNIATLGLSSVYWNNSSVSSKGAATGFANGSVTYNNAVAAGAIDFSYSNLDSGYTFKGWYDSSGNKLSDSATYSGYQQGHMSNITYYAYFQKKAQALSTPTITIGGESSAVNVTSGNSTTVTITNFASKFSDAATTAIYTLKLYKEGSSTAIKTMTTASTTFTPDASAKYYVKCEPTSGYTSSWSESTSNKVDVALTTDTTIYIKKTMPTFTHIHLWNGANTTNISDAGKWPGDQFTSWSTTSDGKYYYKTYSWDCATFKFILNNNNNYQTSDSAAYATGKSYYIDTATARTSDSDTTHPGVLIEGVPANSQKYAVTFKKADNTTITGTYEGTNFSTVSADAVVQVYDGDEISFTVTAASGYHIDSLTSGTTPAFSPAVTKTYKLSNVTAAKTITPTAKADVNITAKTNKSSRGTVTIDKNKSFKGDTVKITVIPLAGTLKTLTATYAGSGETYEYNNSKWTKVTTGSSTNNALLGAFLSSAKDKFALAPTGAETDEAAIAALPDLAPVGAAQTINMVMQEDSAVTINAVFDTYSADSTWYYNGYDNSGNAVSGYHSKQMTESMVGGEKFSYYHVEGRTGADQLMTFTDGSSATYGYVYFTCPGSWTNLHVYFFDGVSWNWPGDTMTAYGTSGNYRYQIPSGAKKVIFNNGDNSYQTVDIDLTSTCGAYYVSSGETTTSAAVGEWSTVPTDAGISTGKEYFYQNSTYNGDYTGDFNTKGFYNHYTAGKEFAKPKDLGTNTGDYYINVLYPNTTYTINGVTKKTGTNPMIIWSAEPLASDDENVTVYAKDGAIRAETFGSTYANIADTKIYAADGTSTVGTKHNGSITNQTYETYKAAKGDTLVIKTQIGATDSSDTGVTGYSNLRSKYYVRGFCVNGEVSELLEWNADGLYTLTYKIPEDTEITKFEITPIYYLKDTEANPIVTYRVTGFTDELKAVGAGKPGWGDTLYTYPFYGKLGGQNNAFGAYPGQPMVYYKGQYQMQIPVKSTAWDPYEASASTVNNTTVSGVTMSNGYWDSVHKQIMGYGDNSTSADHVQTYDYGDFYKIFNEKKPVNNIVFDFKYRTAKHNLTDIITTNTTASALESKYGTGGNGFELLTNFHGRNVDLFGTPLSGDAADPSKTTPVYVVSTGGVIDNTSGVENIAGYYATEWVVYGNTSGTTYQRITGGSKNSIPPEVLVLNDDDDTSFNTGTYPSAVDTTAKPYKITDWKALYTALEAYRGKPVMISYEAADAQQGQEMYYTGTGGATRNDGRWLYSKNGENITSKIKIQYSDDNGTTWVDNEKTPKNGLSAYFTNDGVEGEMTYSTTIDPDKTFDFEAKTTNGNYKFVGWYMEDGTKITSDNASYTERSGSYTFVAKFMQVTTGQLILSHSADKGTIDGTNYQGAGTAKIGVVVKNSDGETVRTYDLSTSDITLDDKIIKSDNSDYTIEVTLEATATGNDMLGTTVLANPSGQDTTYFSSKTDTSSGKTRTIVLNSFTVASLFSGTTQNVKNIIYHSYFGAVTFYYDLLFQYTDRFGETKKYYRQGYLTAAQAANENYVKVFDVDQGRHERRLMPAFIETIAPHVSNFGEDIDWGIVDTGYAFGVQDYAYTLTNVVLSNQTQQTKRNVTFRLPYDHTNGIAIGGNSGTAATTTNFELTGNNAVTFDTIPTLLNNGVNGIYTEDEKKNWIAAPATLSDNGTTKYFQYWSVKSTAADKDTDPEVARCYFQGFNFVALDNYTVTPIYDVSPADITKSGIYSGISYLETSRNQWNTKADSPKEATSTAADLLYNDFILNYNFKGAEIYNNDADSADIVELGVVVERVQELGINQDGSKDTNISHYTSLDKDETNVTEAANRAATNGQVTVTLNGKKFYKQVVDKGSLDNKNRIKFYDAFYNGAGWNMEKQTSAAKYTYKNYVYRAYTYIKYTDQNGDTQIKLADAPAYFTMYDEATATYEAPKSTTSGN